MNEPRQIDYREWHELFNTISDEAVEQTRYYRHLPEAEWSQYLFPPSTHAVYGNRLLRKLKFDNSPAALRLWGFVLSEGERIYRARQAGMKVAAVMGDLGAVTPLLYSFPDLIAFYPDCLWWTPFLMESRVLFDEAAAFGLGDDCCFVRAALGAFSKKAYFPQPEISIATVGATCDDMAAVISEAGFLGNEIRYFELPLRNDTGGDKEKLIRFLKNQYIQITRKLEDLTGVDFSEQRFFATIEKVNRLRGLIQNMKRLCAVSKRNPMGAAEMMNVEFAALSYYGDIEECLPVLEEINEEMTRRVESGTGYPGQKYRLAWITPPADALLLNYAENLGGRVVGSEYVINQTAEPFSAEGDPFEILAENHIRASLMGSSDFRVNLILEQVRRGKAEGAIISGIFGSTHCPYETAPIVEALRERGIPVLAFDVVAPGKKLQQSQTLTRMEAFMESLRARRSRYAG